MKCLGEYLLEINELAIGLAAEHLVCADLLLAGYTAYRTEQLCAYDVVAEVEGKLVRIQVKGTLTTRAVPQRVNHRAAYQFNVRKAGRGGKRLYAPDAFDMLALVAIDCNRIAYLPPSDLRQTYHIRAHDDPTPSSLGGPGGRVFNDFPFIKAFAEVVQ